MKVFTKNNKTIIFTQLFCLCLLILISSCHKKDNPITVVVVPDPPKADFSKADIPITSDIVMYEINERAFSKAGNFAGVMARLDSIKALGVNVIWLMPVFPIGVTKSINSPYCTRDYNAVNAEFGTLDELKNLVKAAHKLKMAVVLDWVANHTSWDNPWIANKDWYTQDGSGNIIKPGGTNWQDVADLNFDNSVMRLEMIKSMKYWVTDVNIDGFRCDAADYVPFSFWKQAIDTMNNIPNRKVIMLAEGSRADHFQAGFQLNFGWDFFAKNKKIFKSSNSALGFYQTHQSEYASIPAGAHKLRFTSNHDECAFDNTPEVLFGGLEASINAFMISAYMGGVPLLYNGQEVACPTKLPIFTKYAIDWSDNPDIFKQYKQIMAFRAAHPALRNGALDYYADADVVVFKRSNATDAVLFFANIRSDAKIFDLPTALQNTTWTNGFTNQKITLGTQLSLIGNESLVLKK
jgi:glycosidase